MTDLTTQYIMADKSNSIIKVVGVGGGGGNAVNHMYNQGIEEVTFDRGGFLYHGRVKELADGAREAGLKF